MRVCIVIPTYNEAGTIRELVAAIRASTSSLAPRILVVDDNSPDGTANVASSLNDENLHVLKREDKLGLGSAYKAGFQEALTTGADWVVQMDADLSHDPADIVKFMKSASEADLIIGSRYVAGGAIRGWGVWRHFISRSAMLFARTILKLPVKDVTSGFRLWRADFLARVLKQPITGNGYAFQEEMLYRALQQGGRVVEVPILFTDRRVGQSKLSWRDVGEFFLLMIRLRVGK
jgi:dolichol-phosphate mannosyltransferase